MEVPPGFSRHTENNGPAEIHSSTILSQTGGAVVGGVQGLPIIYCMGDSGIAEGFHFLFYTAEIPPCCSQREDQPQLCPLEQGVPSTTLVSQFIVSTGMWCHFIYLVLAWIQLYLEDISPNNQNIINQSAIFIYV